MKWNKKEKPKPGDVRFVKQFLFLPKCLKTIGPNDTLTYRWLEIVYIKQTFTTEHSCCGGLHNPHEYKWIDIGWVNGESNCIEYEKDYATMRKHGVR